MPPDLHLGTSSSSNLAWLELIHQLTGRAASAVEFAEKAYALDGVVGEKGGKQDGYAAALGGFNLLRFGRADQAAKVEPVHLSPERISALERRLILCDAGESPNSGKQHEQVWARFAQGDGRIRDTLRAIRDTAPPARDALAAGDWQALGALLSRNRELAGALGGGSVSDRMNQLFLAADNAGALGSKPCGAGGGGVLVILCADESRTRVEQALAEAGGRSLPFRFAPRRD